MIKKLSIALLALCLFCLVGCETKDFDDIMTRKYEFDNYAEYKIFYDNFCEYNQARYIMPENNDSIEFTYFFAATTWKSNADKDEFTLKYLRSDAWVEVKNLSGYTLFIDAYDVCYDYDAVIDNISEIRYVVDDNPYREDKEIKFLIGYTEVASAKEVANEFIDSDGFTEIMDRIIAAYKGEV